MWCSRSIRWLLFILWVGPQEGKGGSCAIANRTRIGIVVKRVDSECCINKLTTYMADGFGSCLVVEGCQSGCDGEATPTTKPTGASSSQEPVLGKPTVAPSTGVTTTDGTCGASNDNTICGNWPQGSCCSLYGVSALIIGTGRSSAADMS